MLVLGFLFLVSGLWISSLRLRILVPGFHAFHVFGFPDRLAVRGRGLQHRRCSSLTFAGIHDFASRRSLWFSGFGNLGILDRPLFVFHVFGNSRFCVTAEFVVFGFWEFGNLVFSIFQVSDFLL